MRQKDDSKEITKELEALRAENAKLQKRLDRVRPRMKVKDGVVVFKSPYGSFVQFLSKARVVQKGNSFVTIPPPKVEFRNGVAVVGPNETFEELDLEGKLVKVGKITRMREIEKEAIAARKRRDFVEVTEDEDLKILTWKERRPPSEMIEFRGPLIELPAIPEPPPEAQETLDTLSGKRRAFA